MDAQMLDRYELRQRGSEQAIYVDGSYVGKVEPVTRRGGYSATVGSASAFGRSVAKAIEAAVASMNRVYA